ncbi:hypothetical protein AMECASPLE_035158 [Ameca splendens]|uniref:Uncharacterized protein n=1 Tax=Ameca splendens TaxID=208324 RepID=A0ABV0YID1_9TELE
MKTQNSVSEKITLHQVNEKELNPEIWTYRTVSPGSVQYLLSVLGLGSFCMNYCISAPWHGDQPVVLLRCSGSPGFITGFSSSALLVLVSLIFLWTTVHKLSRNFGSEMFAGVTMVIKAGFGTFGGVGQYQVLLGTEISIFMKFFSRKHEVL